MQVIISILLFLFSGAFALVLGQTVDAVKPTVVVGDVVAIGEKKFVVGAKTGPVDIVITEKSVFKRVSAENPNLATATPGSFC